MSGRWQVNKQLAKRDRDVTNMSRLKGTVVTRAQKVKDFVECFGSLLTDCPRSQKTVIRRLDSDNTGPLISDHVCSHIFNSPGSTNTVQSGDTCCACD